MITYNSAPPSLGPPSAVGVFNAASTAGAQITSNVAVSSPDGITWVVTLQITPTLAVQQAIDAYLRGCGCTTTYPMTATAPATAAVGSTVTVTADTGDAAFAGDVDFYVGGVLQGPVAAVGGKASLPVTGNPAGDVTVTAWVPAYGYASATVMFQ